MMIYRTRRAIKTFTKFAEVVGTDIMNPLMIHVKNLMEDKKWRVRIAAYETIHNIALQFKVTSAIILSKWTKIYIYRA